MVVMDTATQSAPARPTTPVAPAMIVGWLSALLALGSALLAVSHAGVTIPLLSGLGPGGDRVVAPAVIAFTVATVLAGLVAVGAFRRRAWAWALGLVVHALAVFAATTPYRGVGSLAAIVLAVAAAAVLVSSPGRRSLLQRDVTRPDAAPGR